MAKIGLLIDYKWCTNCHSCEVACRMEHGTPIGQWGIKVYESGAFKTDDGRWQLDYMPIPTILCDMCADRLEEGKDPMCVHHCCATCLHYGTPEELETLAEGAGERCAIFYPVQDR